jgi:acyl-CoA thioesterase FadM
MKSEKNIAPQFRLIKDEAKKVFVLTEKITADLTNAEGNMTHYEYVRLFSRAVEGFVARKLSVQVVPAAMSFEYIKDVLPGQKIEIHLWLHQTERDTVIFLAEFLNPETKALHAVGVQTLYTEKRNHDLPVQIRDSKACGQLTKLQSWLQVKNLGAKYANFVYTHTVRVDFGRTSHFGNMCTYEFAHIFGETRELFGLHCIPKFQKEVGKKYILITKDANYSLLRSPEFGEKIRVKMWIDSCKGASFTLRAEFWSGRVLCAIASQRIAYWSLLKKKFGLPLSLKRQIGFISGSSSRIIAMVRQNVMRLLAPLNFLWR